MVIKIEYVFDNTMQVRNTMACSIAFSMHENFKKETVENYFTVSSNFQPSGRRNISSWSTHI